MSTVLQTGFLLASLLLSAQSATQCAKDGSDYSYTETISGQTRSITTTFCPNHPYKVLNPNVPIKASTTISIPAYPMYDPSRTSDLTEQGGIIGVTFSGVMIFSPYGGTEYGKVTGYSNSAVAAEGDTFDLCSAHSSTSSEASYHHHVPPSCLLNQLGASDTSHSPQVGWAHDGFPVYGNRGPGGVLMQSCNITGGTYGVDVCTNNYGGYYKELSGVDNFVFRYYLQGPTNNGTTCTNPLSPLPGAEYHPSTPTAYFGCCPSGLSCISWLTSCSTSSSTMVNGYTSSYVASSSVLYPSGLTKNCAACWTSGESGTTPSSCSSNSSSSTSSSAALSVSALASPLQLLAALFTVAVCLL